MGKFKRNYKDVDRSSGGYSGDVPKPGVYDAELKSCAEHTSSAGNEGTEWVFEITEEPYAGWRGWVYTNEEGAAWKEAQVLTALGIISEDDDTVNTTHEQIVKKSAPVRVKVTNEVWEGEKRARIKTVLAMPEGKKKSKGEAKKSKKGKDDSPF